jgi:hypothetical protein
MATTTKKTAMTDHLCTDACLDLNSSCPVPEDYSDTMYYMDEMDGDAESALASAGWGTDEDYGHYGGEE